MFLCVYFHVVHYGQETYIHKYNKYLSLLSILEMDLKFKRVLIHKGAFIFGPHITKNMWGGYIDTERVIMWPAFSNIGKVWPKIVMCTHNTNRFKYKHIFLNTNTRFYNTLWIRHWYQGLSLPHIISVYMHTWSIFKIKMHPLQVFADFNLSGLHTNFQPFLIGLS